MTNTSAVQHRPIVSIQNFAGGVVHETWRPGIVRKDHTIGFERERVEQHFAGRGIAFDELVKRTRLFDVRRQTAEGPNGLLRGMTFLDRTQANPAVA